MQSSCYLTISHNLSAGLLQALINCCTQESFRAEKFCRQDWEPGGYPGSFMDLLGRKGQGGKMTVSFHRWGLLGFHGVTLWQQFSSNFSLIWKSLWLPAGNALSLTVLCTMAWGVTQVLFLGGLTGESYSCAYKRRAHAQAPPRKTKERDEAVKRLWFLENCNMKMTIFEGLHWISRTTYNYSSNH